MKNGYRILWTDFALLELERTIKYIEENWTEKEVRVDRKATDLLGDFKKKHLGICN